MRIVCSQRKSWNHPSANSTKSFWTHPKRPGFACVRSFQCIDNQWILKVPRCLPETLENSMPPCRVFLQAKEHAALWIHLPHPKASKEKLLSDSQQRRCEASRCLDVNLKDTKSSLRPMDRRLLLLILHVDMIYLQKHPVFFNSSQPYQRVPPSCNASRDCHCKTRFLWSCQHSQLEGRDPGRPSKNLTKSKNLSFSALHVHYI